jgi:hypothetical protein
LVGLGRRFSDFLRRGRFCTGNFSGLELNRACWVIWLVSQEKSPTSEEVVSEEINGSKNSQGDCIKKLGAHCRAGRGVASASTRRKSTISEHGPLDQYLASDRDGEIALARSAAPESISRDAEVMVLGKHGYETAVKGKNGFVCLVQRSWTAGIDDPDFWNPKLRAPICFNPPAAQS